MRVVLFGMKHCGKTTLGRRLAGLWDCPFYDIDTLIEDAFRSEECRSMTVREILGRYGENGFAAREEAAVIDLARRLEEQDAADLRAGASPGHYVVALGGRTPLNPKLRPVLTRMGLNVFLDIGAEEAWRRVQRSGIPSFLTGPDPRAEFFALYRDRRPHYRSQADLTLQLSGLDQGQALERLVAALEERGHAREGGHAR